MKSLLITSITLLCAVTNLLAQDRPDARRRPREGRDEGGKPGEAFFERFDKDNNGSLSKEEFNALRETIAKWRGTPDRGPAEARREGDKGREPGMRKGEGDKPNRPHPEAMRRGPGPREGGMFRGRFQHRPEGGRFFDRPQRPNGERFRGGRPNGEGMRRGPGPREGGMFRGRFQRRFEGGRFFNRPQRPNGERFRRGWPNRRPGMRRDEGDMPRRPRPEAMRRGPKEGKAEI